MREILVDSSDYILLGLSARCTARVRICPSTIIHSEPSINHRHSVYVGMPRIAQDQVSDASLEFLDSSFTDPESEQVTISQKATLHNPSIFTPTLDGFPADLYLVTNGQYGAEPMLSLPMPKIHAGKGGTNASIENAVSKINSLEQVTNYATTVMTSEYVTTALVGKTKLHLGSLPVQSVKFNSTSTYKGLSHLAHTHSHLWSNN